MSGDDRTRWRVIPPYQVHHDGVTYGPGDTFAAREDMLTVELGAGWIEPAPAEKSTRPTRKRSAK